ncbi:hypothetical protein GH733_001362 [Mirounga leonina]|nr:hypothetical protein GH733_001326 [Mirounga leonina]KAF3828127.1 hypothetical protein GH733_001362 [Mirounga leonina]
MYYFGSDHVQNSAPQWQLNQRHNDSSRKNIHRLVFGMLYPAYYSYKAVKTKNVKEYVRWMMYWIVFALYTVIETVTDQTVAWFPLYYELKIAFVVWLLSPYTKGASLIYRKFLHPLLSSKEREIDDYIVQAKERGYETVVSFGRQGLAFAATAAVTAAVKNSSRKNSYGIPLKDGDEKTDEEAEGPYSDDEMLTHKGLRRSQSMKSVKTVKGRKEVSQVRYGSLKYKVKKRPQLYALLSSSDFLGSEPEIKKRMSEVPPPNCTFRPLRNAIYQIFYIIGNASSWNFK